MIKPIDERPKNSIYTKLLKKLREDDRTKSWVNDETIIVTSRIHFAWWFYKANDENRGRVISFFKLAECCGMKKNFKLIEDKNGRDTYFEPDFNEDLEKLIKKIRNKK